MIIIENVNQKQNDYNYAALDKPKQATLRSAPHRHKQKCFDARVCQKPRKSKFKTGGGSPIFLV